MNENHQMIFIAEGKSSVAFYTLSNPNDLILFIHGFGGEAIGTWDEFPIFVRNYQEFKNCDIIFYGYDSMKLQANVNASILLGHLKMFSTPPREIEGIRRDDINEKYNHIILVAHSLGAVIIRRVLLNANKEEAPWLQTCKMVLFAPAHKGAFVHRLAMEALPGLFKTIGFVARYFLQSLNDLDSDSDTIQDIKNETEKLLNAKQGDFTKAAAVIWAENDRVVVLGSFGGDPNPITVHGKNHINVCKPELDVYQSPSEILCDEIRKK